MNPVVDQAEAIALAAYHRAACDPQELEYREAAAQEIERLGWHQGSWISRDGRISMDQALLLACRAAPLELFDATMRHLERELGEDIYLFNDAEGRSVEEVLAALRGTS